MSEQQNLTTIAEAFELPSKGMIYDPPISPKVSLRSMTTAQELRRLSPTETPYKTLCDIIEECTVEKLGMHVTEMCEGDYEFLLHKLRIVSYGPEYNMLIKCPECGEITESVANLETLKIKNWIDDYNADRIITLPVTNHQIELNFSTPHGLDLIAYRAKERKKQLKSPLDYTLIYKLMAAIKTIDGMNYRDSELEKFVEDLPAKDGNYLLNKYEELNAKVGVNNVVEVTCASCGKVIEAPFRFTAEFFRPTIR